MTRPGGGSRRAHPGPRGERRGQGGVPRRRAHRASPEGQGGAPASRPDRGRMNHEEDEAMAPNELEARPKQKVERREETTRPGAYFQPAVDILETKDELVLVADMPGVPPDGVDVDLEGAELSSEGRARSGEYDGLKPLYVEYGWAVTTAASRSAR